MRWNPTEVTSFWFLWERCLPLFRACVRFRKITETPPPCIYANGRRSQTRRSVVIAAALVYLHSASLDRPRARARAPVLHHHSWKKESHLAKFKFFLLLNNVVLGLELLPTGKLDVHARTAALRFDADEDTPPCSLLIWILYQTKHKNQRKSQKRLYKHELFIIQ